MLATACKHAVQHQRRRTFVDTSSTRHCSTASTCNDSRVVLHQPLQQDSRIFHSAVTACKSLSKGRSLTHACMHARMKGEEGRREPGNSLEKKSATYSFLALPEKTVISTHHDSPSSTVSTSKTLPIPGRMRSPFILWTVSARRLATWRRLSSSTSELQL